MGRRTGTGTELNRRLAEERRLHEEAARKRRRGREKETNVGGRKRMLAFNPADDDWRVARENLGRLKSGPMKFVKDRSTQAMISQITRQIVGIVAFRGSTSSGDHLTLLSSLAKPYFLW